VASGTPAVEEKHQKKTGECFCTTSLKDLGARNESTTTRERRGCKGNSDIPFFGVAKRAGKKPGGDQQSLLNSGKTLAELFRLGNRN